MARGLDRLITLARKRVRLFPDELAEGEPQTLTALTLGQIYSVLGRYKQSQDFFTMVISGPTRSGSPAHRAYARLGLARALLPEAERPEEAVAAFERLVTDFPGSPWAGDAHVRLIDVKLERQSDLPSRLPAHEKSVRLVPVRVRKEPGGPLGEESPLSRAMILYVSPAASDMAKEFAAFLVPGKEEGGKRNEREDMPGSQGKAGQEAPVAVADASGVGNGEMDAADRQDAYGNMEAEIAGRLGLNGSAAEPVARGIAENAQTEPVPLDTNHPSARPQHVEETEAEKTQTIPPTPSEDSAPHPVASEPSAAEGVFFAWITAHAVPVGLGGACVVALAVALGSLGMKRARHRSDVMRRYRP